ncbi:MAG: RNA polymerase factor sigma-54 [bacterium]|nr:RNA polymerase factor sigma-54 [bacterium]
MERQNLQQSLHQLQVNILYQKLLQASAVELSQICENAAEENPFLEFEKNYSHFAIPEHILERISGKSSFIDRLKMEISYLNLDPEVSGIADLIIELIDDDGYLRFSIDEMCQMLQKDASVVQKALNVIQSLEPPGIAARDFQECFILQMKAKKMENTPAFKVLKEYGKDFLEGRFSLIKKKMKLTDTQLSTIIAEIRKLDPFPARAFFLKPEEILPKFPDFIIKSFEPTVSIEFGEDRIFKIFVNEAYIRVMKAKTIHKNEKVFLNQKMNQAKKFLMYIENRRQFLGKLIRYIVEYQRDFICNNGILKPLTETELAEKFSCSLSLVSRAISRKYISYGSHIFSVKQLFSYPSGKLSQKSVMDEIENITKNSDTALSDRQISERLKEKGIVIAPRTVNKYRKRREILNSYLRRSFDKMEKK